MNKKGQAFFKLGNAVILLYAVVKILASLVEGGGGYFVVKSFGLFIYVPMWLIIIIGLFKVKKGVCNNKHN